MRLTDRVDLDLWLSVSIPASNNSDPHTSKRSRSELIGVNLDKKSGRALTMASAERDLRL